MRPKQNDKHFDPQAELRRAYIAAIRDFERRLERTLAAGDHCFDVSVDLSPFLELRCGARGKRTGKPCPQTGLFRNGRCRWHGGLSTGPKTEEGKVRSAKNILVRWNVEQSLVQGRPDEISPDPQHSAGITTSWVDEKLRRPTQTVGQTTDHPPDDRKPVMKFAPHVTAPPTGQPVRQVGTKSTLGSIRAAIEAAGTSGLTIVSLQRRVARPQHVVEAGVRLLCTMGLAERKECTRGAVRFVRRGR